MSEQPARSPWTPPLPCFGLEFQPEDARCVSCPAARQCREVLGERQRHAPLDKVVFDFSIRQADDRQELSRYAASYALAHERVFGKVPRQLPGTATELAVVGNSRDLKMSSELYTFACMVGHKVSCPERLFVPRFLEGETAVKRATFYRKEAAKAYGVADTLALGLLSGVEIANVRRAMQDSELLFGSWIVGERVKRGGNGLKAFYRARELALSPYWLAVEKTHETWARESPGSPVLDRHRRSIGPLISSTPDLVRIRAGAMQPVIAAVLAPYALKPEDLRFASPVASAARLWTSLGDAISQYGLLRQLWA